MGVLARGLAATALRFVPFVRKRRTRTGLPEPLCLTLPCSPSLSPRTSSSSFFFVAFLGFFPSFSLILYRSLSVCVSLSLSLGECVRADRSAIDVRPPSNSTFSQRATHALPTFLFNLIVSQLNLIVDRESGDFILSIRPTIPPCECVTRLAEAAEAA